jgi:hypothetical protein
MSPRDLENRVAGRHTALQLLMVEMLVASCRNPARRSSYFAQMLNRLTARAGTLPAASSDTSSVAAASCMELLQEIIGQAEQECALRNMKPRVR